MPTPSKFTESIRGILLEALRIGASRRTACQIAGVDPSQMTRWMKKGEESRAPDSQFRLFREEVLKAESEPKLRALGVVWRAMPDKPDLAWKFIERREAGYAPPMPNMPALAEEGPIIIRLTLPDSRPLPRPLPLAPVSVDPGNEPA